ncbi:sulfotransferase family protein [Aequorivita marina]|uniref:sulfotransferase family protein n=1 Tax=Aequorivita marina TaxID=3073654 RepID=UPI0028767130|nr:sulfotransferase [Aequorivita sp. S2608]MDS1299074.1 sulfotransferase [Aequorivita sp. S2608]
MKKKLKKILRPYYYQIKFGKGPKVFGVGRNKTGTTSLTAAMKELGYTPGIEDDGAKLLEEWAVRDFKKLIKYCHTGNFFQDVPFSLPYTYQAMDKAFPNSKFILTVRDSSDQWYNSVLKHVTRKSGKNGQLPTKEDLKNSNPPRGNRWRNNRLVAITPEDKLYDKDLLIKHYENYNKTVKDYFRHRPDDLLILNVAENGAYKKLCDFLGKETDKADFPWKNKNPEKAKTK